MATRKSDRVDTAFSAMLLMHVCERIAHGDDSMIQTLGLMADDVQALAQLRLTDFIRIRDRLDSLPFPCVEITLKPAMLHHTTKWLQARHEDERLMLKLIAADTPRSWMRRLYGLHNSEYSELRKRLGLSPNPGRKMKPSPAEVMKTSQALQALGCLELGQSASSRLTQLSARELLCLGEMTGVTMRTLCKALDIIVAAS